MQNIAPAYRSVFLFCSAEPLQSQLKLELEFQQGGRMTGRWVGYGGAQQGGLQPSSLCANSFSYTLAHVAKWFCWDLLVLRCCRCVHKPLHTSASHLSHLSAFTLLPALSYFHFFLFVSFSHALSGCFSPYTLNFPEALLAWSDKERTFLFTFRVNLK